MRAGYSWLMSLALSLIASKAAAQPQPRYIENPAGLVRHAYLSVNDQVSGRCWTNSSAIEFKLRIMFEQNDVAVSQEPFVSISHSAVYVEINGLGLREENGRCVSTAEFVVIVYGQQTYGGSDNKQTFLVSTISVVFRHRSIFTSISSNNAQFNDFFEASSADYLADVLAARRNKDVKQFFSTYPNYGKDVMKLSEWQEILDKSNAEKNSSD